MGTDPMAGAMCSPNIDRYVRTAPGEDRTR